MSKEKKFKFKYKYSKDYNPLYVNGAFGMRYDDEEIVLNFYHERYAIPKSTLHDVDEEGNVEMIPTDAIEPEDYHDSMIRFIQSGVVINLDAAKSLHILLGNLITKLDADESED